MANRKKKDEALAAVQAQTEGSGQPAVQSGYSAAGLDSRSEVENALANSSYKPSQTVTDAADALKEWQANRPGDYQSSYQERIDQLLNQLLQRESFSTATPRIRSTASTSRTICRTPTTPAQMLRRRLQP